jgi:acetoin utilization protein AcuC
MDNRTAILYRDELKEYDFGPGHSFRGDRYQIFPKFLTQKLEPDDNYQFLKAEPATDEDLRLICDPEYITFTREFYRAANLGLGDDSRFFIYQSMDNYPIGKPGKLEEAARIIIGQAKLAADLIQSEQYRKVISLGGGMHHAKRASGEGFCLYNDVAFTGIYLTEVLHLERVLILDTDAHAANGTAEYFDSDPRVLLIDLHQDPRSVYPGTGFANEIGSGKGTGRTVNVPMPIRAGNDSYRMVFEEIVEPLTKEFQPQIIIRNGGSDPHFSDELTTLGLTMAGFRMIGEKVRKMSEICDGKVIDLIASGYKKEVLPYAWMAMLSGVAHWDVPLEEPLPVPAALQTDSRLKDTVNVINDVKNALKDYWKCFWHHPHNTPKS